MLRCLVFLAAVTACVEPALADDCDSILNSNLLSQNQLTDVNAAKDAVASSFCDKTLSEAQSGNSLSVGGSYGVISANVASSSSSFNSWKHDNCGEMSSDQQKQRYYLSAQRGLSSSAVEAWRQCKLKSVGLSCIVSPEDDQNEFVLLVGWRPPGLRESTIISSSVTNAEVVGNSNGLDSVLQKDASIHPGTSSVIIRRRDPLRTVNMVINVEYDKDESFTCKASVPRTVALKIPSVTVAAQKPPAFQVSGDWCLGGNPFFQNRQTADEFSVKFWDTQNSKWTNDWWSPTYIYRKTGERSFEIERHIKVPSGQASSGYDISSYHFVDNDRLSFDGRTEIGPNGQIFEQGIKPSKYVATRCR